MQLIVMIDGIELKVPLGEKIVVRLMHEGRDPGQGVAYLNVAHLPVFVNNGALRIGKEAPIYLRAVTVKDTGRVSCVADLAGE